MSLLNGSDVLVFINDGISDIPIACQRGVTIDFSDAMIDATCKQSGGYQDSLAGKREFSFTADALVDFDNDGNTQYTIAELFSAVENKTLLTINIANPAFSNIYYLCMAYVESIEANAPMEDVVTYTASFKGTGIIVNLFS